MPGVDLVQRRDLGMHYVAVSVEGHYCPRNSTKERQVMCPAGRYGSVKGLGTRTVVTAHATRHDPASAAWRCEHGGERRCQHGRCWVSTWSGSLATLTRAKRTATMSQGMEMLSVEVVAQRSQPGYWCPPASVSPTQIRCGNTSVYCPEGSDSPTLAPPGFYTIEGRIVEGEHRVTHFGGQQRGNAPATPVTTVTQQQCEHTWRHICVCIFPAWGPIRLREHTFLLCRRDCGGTERAVQSPASPKFERWKSE